MHAARRHFRMICKSIGKVRLLLAAAAILLGLPHGSAQQPASATSGDAPAYDIVSIKPTKDPRTGNIDISINDNLFTARDLSLRDLLAQAYTIDRDLIHGLPRWALDASYDINAKMLNPDRTALSKLTREQWGALLEPMLADRFHLQAHTEVQTLPVYDLVVNKSGPKFHSAGHHVGATGIGINNQHLTATESTMPQLAGELSPVVHRTVIDRTGLAGQYDFTCDWTSPRAADGSPQDSAASLFTALEEQLGLKLRPAKGPVTTLIVDHVEPPSPD